MVASYCTNCGHELTAGGRFCSRCGHEVASLSSEVAQQDTSHIRLAGRWVRLWARLLDGLIIWGILIVLAAIQSSLRNTLDNDYVDAVSVAFLVMGLAIVIGYFIWQAVLLSKLGQTIGKRIVHIRIVKRSTNQNGGFITNVLVREIANAVLSIIIPLYTLFDVLWILSPSRRTLHDRIADTVVIDV